MEPLGNNSIEITSDLSCVYSSVAGNMVYNTADDTIYVADFQGNREEADTITAIIPYKMFEDCLPPLEELKKMCEEYPTLGKAYETLKTIYQMVEDDWKNKKTKKY